MEMVTNRKHSQWGDVAQRLWQNKVAMGALILVLIIRPQGFASKKGNRV